MLQAFSTLIHNPDHQVIAMQVDSCHYLLRHIGFLSVSLFVFDTDNNVLPEGNLLPPLCP